MIFVPFTGIDNHCCNITFGAGLLSSESIESYKWLLEKFTEAFGKPPNIVVTDQDAAMKQAIEFIWPNTRHRFCMWHIMTKVAEKVGNNICNDDEFKTRICNIVWTDSISPEEFEIEWLSIMEDYELIDNNWFNLMFELRSMWIPAYYCDETMSGLMRTTSRSESENHFFGQFSNVQLTLLEFLTHFDTAMESQRHKHRENDHKSRYTTPNIWSNSSLEVQAYKIFTRNIFFDQQEEIYDSIYSCLCTCSSQDGEWQKFLIKDKKAFDSGFFEVLYQQNEDDITIKCSCRRFEQYGLLCKHCFYALRMCEVNAYPEKYILKRWTKDVAPNTTSYMIPCHILSGMNKETNNVVREIISSSEHVINKIVNDYTKLCMFRDRIKDLTSTFEEESVDTPDVRQKDIVSSLIPTRDNMNQPVHRPSGIRNKGCGSHKRFKSNREQALSRMGKRSRNCHVCGKSGHDRRTCPTLKNKQQGSSNNESD